MPAPSCFASLLCARSSTYADPCSIAPRLAVAALKDLPEPTSSILSSTLTSLLPPSTPLAAHIASFQAAHASSPAHILGAVRASLVLAPETLQNVLEPTLFSLLSPNSPTSLAHAVAALQTLDRARSTRADEFRTLAKARWEVARVFDTVDERAARRQEWLANEQAEKDARAAVADN